MSSEKILMPILSSPRKNVGRVSKPWSLIMAYAILAALMATYGALQPQVMSMQTLTATFVNTMPLLLAGMAETVVIVGGGIDLSIGSVMSITTTVVATHMHAGFPSELLWSCIAVLIGLLFGAVNALLIVRIGISSVIVTIATMIVGEGIALFILPSPGGSIPSGFVNLWTGQGILGLPNALWIFVVCVVGWWVFKNVPFAGWLYATGSDKEASSMNGMKIQRIIFASYVLSGGIAAIAGLALSAQLSSGDPNVGAGYLLNSIAAVVIGGTPVSGGRGGFAGTVAGAFIFTLVSDVLFAAGVSPFLTSFFVGLVLVVIVAISVVIDRVIRSRSGVSE